MIGREASLVQGGRVRSSRSFFQVIALTSEMPDRTRIPEVNTLFLKEMLKAKSGVWKGP
jgi:hypothetical protein